MKFKILPARQIFKIQDSGFTLLEVLVAAGVLAVIALAAIFLSLGFKKNIDLDSQSQQIVDTLSIAQSNAKSRRDQASWGVHLESSRYVLFKGLSYNPNNVSNLVYYLADGLEISHINLNGGGSDIIFEEFSGQTQKFGTFRINFVSNPSQYREVRVDYSGRAAVISSVLPPQNSRIFDSRHVHFQLGWTIKNSTKILFYFPRVSQLKEVLMAEYFNPDQTYFDWSGSFLIEGKTQEFRVHTHSLTAFDTLLSITRDRSEDKNNEEVQFFINYYEGQNREIAQYFSDGRVEVRAYGGLMTIQ